MRCCEAVHVDEHDRDEALAPLGLGDDQVEAVLEELAVGQLGERVVVGLVAQARFDGAGTRQAAAAP
jgi:hypothetical protein